VLLEPKERCVYGPVRSRRLGSSLGINPLPPGRKTCTFDCQYCQYGWADPAPIVRRGFPAVGAVLAQVEERLGALAEPPAFLTFSGNGEPTLHPRFPELVAGVLALRDRLAPTARLAILSNSSTLADAAVRAALARLDVRIMKLDAGRPTTFARFNQPRAGITLLEIVAQLYRLGGVTIQALFAGGPMGNAAEEEIEAWVAVVKHMAPVEVQVYSLDRDAPSREIRRLDPTELQRIAARLASSGIDARVY